MVAAMPEYYLRQSFPDLRWQVVSLDSWQAERLRERGEHVYVSARQAWAVARALNKRQAANPAPEHPRLRLREDLSRVLEWPRSLQEPSEPPDTAGDESAGKVAPAGAGASE